MQVVTICFITLLLKISFLQKTPVSVKTLLYLIKSDLLGGLYKMPSSIGLDLGK